MKVVFLAITICVMLCRIALAQPLADGRSVFLGNIINEGANIRSDFLELWNQVTPENAGKWGSVEPTRNQYNWKNLDLIYKFAKDNDLPFRQHHFVDNQQQPSWINNLQPDEIKEEVEEWIRLFGERYPDADFIDVVNEPYKEPAEYREALGGAGTTGYDWIIWCFEKAREYCPNAKLAVNEYGVLNGWTPVNDYIKIINLLKERNLIDAISVEGHFLESATKNTVISKLTQLEKTGLPIYINEFDLNILDDAQHLAKFQELFPALYEHPGVFGVTFWGYVQGQMWRTDGYLIRSNGEERVAMTWLRNYFSGNTKVAAETDVPAGFELAQNYPNPFNPTTTIPFHLPVKSRVRLSIHNVQGQEISTLVDREFDAGAHEIVFHAGTLAAGLYFYHMKTETFTALKKLAIVK